MMEILHEELCTMGNRPLLMDGLFRQILTDYFSQTADMEYPTFQTKLYSDTVPSGIVIDTVYKKDVKQTENRPAILIKRGDWAHQLAGMFGSLKQVDDLVPTRVGLWQGEHQFICLSRSGAEANMLGAEVARFFLHYGQIIRQLLKLHRFVLTSISGLSKISESKDTFAVVVGVKYHFEDAWETYERETSPDLSP